MHYHVSGTIAIFSFLKNEGSYWLVLIPQLICAAEIQNFNNCLRNFASIQQCIANFQMNSAYQKWALLITIRLNHN